MRITFFQVNKDDILVRSKIRATFTPPTFEDKKKGCKQTAMVLDLISWDHLYPENTREMASYRNQIRVPTRPARPWVQTHSYGIMFCPHRIISIKSTRERLPVRSKSRYQRGTLVPLLILETDCLLF